MPTVPSGVTITASSVNRERDLLICRRLSCRSDHCAQPGHGLIPVEVIGRTARAVRWTRAPPQGSVRRRATRSDRAFTPALEDLFECSRSLRSRAPSRGSSSVRRPSRSRPARRGCEASSQFRPPHLPSCRSSPSGTGPAAVLITNRSPGMSSADLIGVRESPAEEASPRTATREPTAGGGSVLQSTELMFSYHSVALYGSRRRRRPPLGALRSRSGG